MEKVSWHQKRGRWLPKAIIVAILCVSFIVSINETDSDFLIFSLLGAIVIYTLVLKFKEHQASMEVEVLKKRATELQYTMYTEEDIEQRIDDNIRGHNAWLVSGEKIDLHDPTEREKQRAPVIEHYEGRKREAEEAYFKQIAKFEAMGYTKEEIQVFHDLTYKHAETDWGGVRNLFMIRLQDNKRERLIKMIVGTLFVLFWGYEIGYFIADNSPFIQWIKRIIIFGIVGYIWASLFGDRDGSEKTYKTCSNCGNLYLGVFCGCYWESYRNYKK